MDEQTTPKKVRRVGSIAFALVLIAAGVLLMVYQLVPGFNLLKILKFSPVLLIVLGVEMLYYSARPDVKVKFDSVSYTHLDVYKRQDQRRARGQRP